MKKYILLKNDTITISKHTLYRIQALIDIPSALIKAGDLGGYIESERNLSQEGKCWVGDNAKVFGNGMIFEDALIFGDAHISEDAHIFGNAQIYGDAIIFGRAQVYGNAHIFGRAQVYGDTKISGSAQIYGDSTICGHSQIFESTFICGRALIRENARVSGSSFICGNTNISKNAIVKNTNDYLLIGPIGSRNDYTTFYKTKNDDIWVSCGCFNGSIEDFEEAVKKRHKNKTTTFRNKYQLVIKAAKYILQTPNFKNGEGIGND